jgi:plasmid stability protein
MPNVLLRDLDDDVLRQLKAAAKANHRSLQAEIHDVLRRAGTRNLAETRRLSSKWLKRLEESAHSDSAILIRIDDEDAHRVSRSATRSGERSAAGS